MTLHDGLADEIIFSPRMRFKIQVFEPLLDHLGSELRRRLDTYTAVCNKFGFLHNLQNINICKLREDAKKFHESYTSDIETNFEEEVIQFLEYIKYSNLM